MKKRLLKLLEAALVIFVVIGCVNLKAEASTSGTGTESDPYGLPNKSEFAGGYRLILPLEDNLWVTSNGANVTLIIKDGDKQLDSIDIGEFKDSKTHQFCADDPCFDNLYVRIELINYDGLYYTFNAIRKPTGTPHNHEWTEGVIKAPTKFTNGLYGIYCKSCAAVRESSVITNLEFILDSAIENIDAAKSGDKVEIDFGELNSFPKSLMKKIAEKSADGVSFIFSYEWNHEQQEVTIPAGTIVDTGFEWYGPAKMNELYVVKLAK